MKILLLAFSISFTALSTHAQYIISTIAGNGTIGYCGDGGPATAAELSYPWGLAIDRLGNIYVADEANERIRVVTTSDTIRTIAGNGIMGFSGDGGYATDAELNGPTGLAIDIYGNIFVSDMYNQRIRKITSSGIISTIAGNDTSGYSGDGGPATAAELNYPQGLCIDRVGNIYISDQENNVIRKVNTSGIISTIAGTGIAGYSGDGGLAIAAELNNPFSVSFDQRGNLFIADSYNSCIRMVDANGVISTIAGNGVSGFSGDGGAATAAQLDWPTDVKVDSTGNIYIVDFSNQRVRMVNPDRIINTIAGTGASGYNGDGIPATTAELYNPGFLLIDNKENVYVSEEWNQRIRKLTPTEPTSITNIGYICSEPITAYPNPTTGLLHINFNATINNADITVTDVVGKTVAALRCTQNNVEIDMCDFANGVYFILIEREGKTYEAKVLKE